jgi:WS/DGAT/MGAT family acyltransferase
MPTYTYERLSAQDSSFLVFESPTAHMHVGGLAILEAGPLSRPEGGLDIDRIRRYIASRLPLIPRYRQRLAFVPVENHPVWVDDTHFNLHYHVRHACLPHPGDDYQLKQLLGRVMSQQLDRGKPLWELWMIEGLQEGRCAVLVKVHHCMVDGVGGVDLLTALMTTAPQDSFDPVPAWEPCAAPDGLTLLADAVRRRAQVPFEVWRGVRGALADPDETGARVVNRLTAAWQTVEAGLRVPPPTPLNAPIGPHRRFDWLSLDLAEVKEVKNRLGGTVNDVVLATAAGGLRRFLKARGVDVGQLDFRVVLPVNMRGVDPAAAGANHVSAWLTSLPLGERDPRKRLIRVQALTTRLRDSQQELGADSLVKVGEWAGSGLLSLGIRLISRMNPFNLIISNVPGPPIPLYLLGAPMVGGFPQVPLFENQGLGIALISYAGRLCWGFNADWDLVPDLDALVAAVSRSFDELLAAARRDEPAVPKRRSRRRVTARTQLRVVRGDTDGATQGSAGS